MTLTAAIIGRNHALPRYTQHLPQQPCSNGACVEGHFVCTSQTDDSETELKRQLHERKVFTFFMYRVFFKIENGLITDVKETDIQAIRI